MIALQASLTNIDILMIFCCDWMAQVPIALLTVTWRLQNMCKYD